LFVAIGSQFNQWQAKISGAIEHEATDIINCNEQYGLLEIQSFVNILFGLKHSKRPMILLQLVKHSGKQVYNLLGADMKI
jgi:hypothetical protein